MTWNRKTINAHGHSLIGDLDHTGSGLREMYGNSTGERPKRPKKELRVKRSQVSLSILGFAHGERKGFF